MRARDVPEARRRLCELAEDRRCTWSRPARACAGSATPVTANAATATHAMSTCFIRCPPWARLFAPSHALPAAAQADYRRVGRRIRGALALDFPPGAAFNRSSDDESASTRGVHTARIPMSTARAAEIEMPRAAADHSAARGRAQELRGQPRARRHRPRGRAGRGARGDRAERQRQEHAAALRQPARADRRRAGSSSRARRSRAKGVDVVRGARSGSAWCSSSSTSSRI